MRRLKKKPHTRKRIILDLCGGTGAASKPYADRGYIVILVTLPRYNLFDIILNMVTGMIELQNLDTGATEYIKASDVYGILAGPTCTMFSLARTTAKTPRDFVGGLALVRKCMDIIWFCRMQEDSVLIFWALENPRALLRHFMGVPHLTFDPCDYGDDYTKKTDLWGLFNLPKKCAPKAGTKVLPFDARPLPPLPEGYVMPKGWNATAARRSITSAFFAEAFYRANK